MCHGAQIWHQSHMALQREILLASPLQLITDIKPSALSRHFPVCMQYRTHRVLTSVSVSLRYSDQDCRRNSCLEAGKASTHQSVVLLDT
jgi:hypothetical protein